MKLSEKYSEKTLKTVGTQTYSLTDTIPNLFPYNETVNDFSFTTTRHVDDFALSELPSTKNYEVKPNDCIIDFGNRKIFGVNTARKSRIEHTKRYVCFAWFVGNNDMRISINKNDDVDTKYGGTTVSSNYSTYQFLRNTFYDQFLITVSVQGFTKEDLINAITTKTEPTSRQIFIEDLYSDPDNFYITDYNIGSKVWSGTTYTTSSTAGICPLSVDVGANTLSFKKFEKAFRIPCITYNLLNTSIPDTITPTSETPQVYANVNKACSVFDYGTFSVTFNNKIEDFPPYKDTKEYVFDINTDNSTSDFLSLNVFRYKYTNASTLGTFQLKSYKYATGKKAIEYISSLGCYLCDTTMPVDATPKTLDTNTHIWLCEQNADGFTTGRLLRGEEITRTESPNKNGSTNDDTFNPNKNSTNDRIEEVKLNDYSFGSSYIKYYAMTESELLNFVQALENNNIPPDNILGVMYAPYDLTLHEHETQPITYKGHAIGDGINATRILNLLHTFDLGDTFITGNNSNYLDYAPYTDINVWIPHCNTISLPTNLFMNNNLHINLISDLSCGACKGVVSVNDTIYTTVNGTMLTSYPVTATDNNQIFSAVVGGGLGAISGVSSIMAGNVVGGALSTAGSISQTIATLNSISPKTISSAGSGAINYCMPNMPVLYMSTPVSISSNYNAVNGYSCDKTCTVSQLRGYTVCDNVKLMGVNATIEIQDLIISKLKSGFYA